jgi:hypothetical protein
VAAISAGCPTRPSGMPADIDSLRSSVSRPPMISVSTGPGASTFTVIPYGPSSRAPPLHISITAALAVV